MELLFECEFMPRAAVLCGQGELLKPSVFSNFVSSTDAMFQ